MHRTNIYFSLIKRWTKIIFGQSYWHIPQEMGKQFVPGELQGYYNDLTGKAYWRSYTDNNGLPLNINMSGKLFYFPATLFQKALAHWDRLLNSNFNNEEDKKAFSNIANWALEHQDKNGGWPIWLLAGIRCTSPYSAMTQGEGISVLVRAYKLFGKEKYFDAAHKALHPLLMTIEKGGTCRHVPEGIILEELPLEQANSDICFIRTL